MRNRWIVLTLIAFISLDASAGDVEQARQNGKQANEALVRSRATLRAYLDRRDPATGLLPRKGGTPTWYVRDSAADLYPFLVLAARYTDPMVYENEMRDILRSEIQYSTRLGRLSDNVLPGGKFEHDDLDLDRLIFGSTEYAKDGLLPLVELLGRTAWFERLVGIADDTITHAPYKGPFGPLPSDSSEVNGELLQVLTRLAYATGDSRYVDQAISIARFYFEEAIPKSNGLPTQLWNLEEGKPASEYFNGADHGNEIVGGLSELVLYLKVKNHPMYERMARSLTELVDLLLDVGLNEDKIWYLRVGWADHKVLDARHAHCWGYLYNAVYTTYLITEEPRFLKAVETAIQSCVEDPTYWDDPEGSGRNYGSNAYSDSIESAIVFLNRLPDDRAFAVLDECVDRFLARQREDGIIEDWYGDGNYVRTALMYALMKSQGTSVQPWREDVLLGAVEDEGGLLLTLESKEPWEGRVRFDIPRHRIHFNMPVNYPRLNEFPEWYTVAPNALYDISIGSSTETRMGSELHRGISISSNGDDPVVIKTHRRAGPPYGGASERRE